MFFRAFIFLVGFGLVIIGSVYIILYLNLLTINYTLEDYFLFIMKRIEVYYLPIGLILITLTILKEDKR